MLNSLNFAKELVKTTGFFAGVPDSVLKHLCTALEQILPESRFRTSVNEGAAVALSAGFTLATGLPGAVYMQNSGLGNAINPLLSLSDKVMYSIPVLLLIGWRGEPGTKDEPQHLKQGIVTADLLDACRIPFKILPDDYNEAVKTLAWAKEEMETTSAPVALLIRNGLFEKAGAARGNGYAYKRENAIGDMVSELTGNEIIVSTTGMISRELYEIREKQKGRHKDLLIAGSMGHASQIALGLALSRSEDKVICLDGDGSVLMHMGSLATIGMAKPSNLIHVMLNNAAHDSVGGHPTGADKVDWPGVAKACGYDRAEIADNPESMKTILRGFLETGKCCFLEVKVAQGARADLGRPVESPAQMKVNFRNKLT